MKSSLEFRVVEDEVDITSLTLMARMAHLESWFREIPFSANKVAAIAKRAISVKAAKKHYPSSFL